LDFPGAVAGRCHESLLHTKKQFCLLSVQSILAPFSWAKATATASPSNVLYSSVAGRMPGKRQLKDAELAAAEYNFAQAKASLACEGIHLTTEEEALFKCFQKQRLPHDECRRQLITFSRAKHNAKVNAAE
jgi:hypothetical protein